MISILIPTYNYSAYPLVMALHQQLSNAKLDYELICVDDGSSSSANIQNQKINSLSNCRFIERKKNVGRNANRQFLAEQAQYDWLLFIDSDTIPKRQDFISNYISFINTNYEAVFGGFAYKENLKKEKSLRYNFGKEREEVSALKRNSLPYKVIISANFLIKKTIFTNLNQKATLNIYGLDYLFGALLKQNKIKVLHVDNEVYHLGLDSNEDYLQKTKKAVKALTLIQQSSDKVTHDISLLKAYEKLKRFHLEKIFSSSIHLITPIIEKNLLGSRPSLFLFDLYRLGYFCKLST